MANIKEDAAAVEEGVKQYEQLMKKGNERVLASFFKKQTEYEKKKSDKDLKVLLGNEAQVDKYKQKRAAESRQRELQEQLKILDETAKAKTKAFEKEQKATKEKAKAAAAKEEALKNDDKAALHKANRELEKAEKAIEKAKKKEEKAANSTGFVGAVEKVFSETGKTITHNLEKSLKNIGKIISEGMSKINSSITAYTNYQTAISTRLQGSNTSFANITSNLNNVAYSPLVNAQSLYSNVNTLINEGIVTNVEQRAFFMTIKDSIATTFDANSESMKALVRLQQEDSTAARLGMESYLTRFLNEYVENTEYLTRTFDNVADKLLQASALLSAQDATEFEYVVQKWLGALTGVGLSESASTSIANAIGKLGSGDTSVFSESIGSLIALGAAKSGIDLGSVISNGLTAVDTNDLLYGVTQVLQDMSTANSNAAKSELASVLGVSITDLKAVSNLNSNTLEALNESLMTNQNMYQELQYQFGQIYGRQGIANVINNAIDNLTYQTGMNIASNPALLATWKITDLIKSATGGTDIPFVTAAGFGIDLNATVEDLIQAGVVGASLLGQIGNIVGQLGTATNGSALFTMLQESVGGGTKVTLGKGLSDYTFTSNGIQRSSIVTSSAGSYVGNANSEDYTNSIIGQKSQEAQEVSGIINDEDQMTTLDYLQEADFATKFSQIAADINSMKTDGITISGGSVSSLSESIVAWYSQNQTAVSG